jgi:hypothetical protein
MRSYDAFFYDEGGKRRLRPYVKWAVMIFMFLLAVLGVNFYTRSQMQAVVMATPMRLDPTFVATLAPTATSVPPTPAVCPSDPSEWTLTELSSTPSVHKNVEPPCVLENFKKYLVWFYATDVLGYTHNESGQTFLEKTWDRKANVPIRFTEKPWKIFVMDDTFSGVLEVDVEYGAAEANLGQWRVDAEGNPASSYAFRGCYLTVSDAGNWWNDYAALCSVWVDEWYYARPLIFNAAFYTVIKPNRSRHPAWFGYKPNTGEWVYLGTKQDWMYDVPATSEPSSTGFPTIDAAYILSVYGVPMKPLPANWKTRTSDAEANAVIHEFDIAP